MKFPLKIQQQLSGKTLQAQTVGLSGAGVWMDDSVVLKAEPESPESRKAAAMMLWLEGKLPAPRLLCRELEGGMDFQLMTRVEGTMACAPEWMTEPKALAQQLAAALQALWQVDVTDCPCDQSLDKKLAEARRRVELGLCDIEHADPATYGTVGFDSPEHLLSWLEAHRPAPDPVLSHGDFCLPNILLRKGEAPGYIDLGRAGVSDRYQDIALCWRSMRDNFGGHYGPAYPGFYPELLFEALNMEPDWEKLHYYRLLDELF